MDNQLANGFLDSIYIKDEHVIFSGWAVCESVNSTFVTIMSDNRPVISGLADLYREDLKGVVSEDGLNAFEVSIPCNVVKGSPNFDIFVHTQNDLIALNSHDVKNHLVTGEENLFLDTGCNLTEALFSNTGYIYDLIIDNGCINCNFISRDNLINNDTSCFEDLTINVNGNEIDIEKFLTYKKLNNTNVIVKSLIEIPIEHSMLGHEVVLSYAQDVLSNLKIPMDSRLVGFIEEVRFSDGKVEIAGWAHDHYKKLEKKIIAVSLKINDLWITGDTIAGSYRGDLKKYLGYGNCAFNIEFNTECKDIDSIEVFASVIDASGKFPLNKANSFKVVFPERCSEKLNDITILATEEDIIVGSVDTVNNNILTGWAKNESQPGVPVLLDIYINDVLFLSSWANRYRPDLAKHFADDGCHAFQVDIAPNVNTFATLNIKVLPRIGINKINQKVNQLEQKSFMKHISEEQGL